MICGFVCMLHFFFAQSETQEQLIYVFYFLVVLYIRACFLTFPSLYHLAQVCLVLKGNKILDRPLVSEEQIESL